MPPKFLIIASEFNDLVTRSLVVGATSTLEFSHPKSKIDLVWVPGAFELPLAAHHSASKSKWDAILCLGCVIKGETPHFDYVCSQAASGIMSASLKFGVPVVFGVLTTDTMEQALARSGLKGGNKGIEAANAAIKTLAALKTIDSLG